jgi:hypothetical protein
MAETRACEHCGSTFTPRREHARFCSARCRVAWNREHAPDPAAEATALDWSLTAMRDATGRLRRERAVNRQRALAAISEAVWWVTIVDATLVRYHPGIYDRVLAAQSAANRGVTEGTLGGLRFVRNQMGQHLDPDDFISQPASRPRSSDRVSNWTWTSLPEPELVTLAGRAKAWELTRYRAYQAHLAGHTIGETFTQAAEFLTLTSTRAATGADTTTSDPPRLRQRRH